jgi:hypothetical protein
MGFGAFLREENVWSFSKERNSFDSYFSLSGEMRGSGCNGIESVAKK